MSLYVARETGLVRFPSARYSQLLHVPMQAADVLGLGVSGLALSCFKLSSSAIFTDVSHVKPEGSFNPLFNPLFNQLFKAVLYSVLWGRELVSMTSWKKGGAPRDKPLRKLSNIFRTRYVQERRLSQAAKQQQQQQKQKQQETNKQKI